MLSIIFAIVVIVLSFMQPKRFRENPTERNKTWSVVYIVSNVCIVLYCLWGLWFFGKVGMLESIFSIITIGVAALSGWLVYVNYIAIATVSTYKQPVQMHHSVSKFCTNCGNSLSQSSAFCEMCGTKIVNVNSANSGVIKPTEVRYNDGLSHTKTMKFVVVISYLIVAFLATQKWLYIESMGAVNDVFDYFGSSQRVDVYYSLFQMSDVLNGLNEYVSSAELSLLSLLYNLMAFAIIGINLVATGVLIVKNKISKLLGNVTLLITGVTGVIYYMLLAVMNEEIYSSSYEFEFMRGTLESTMIPMIVLAMSIVVRVVLGKYLIKLDDAYYANVCAVRNQTNSSLNNPTSTLREVTHQKETELSQPIMNSSLYESMYEKWLEIYKISPAGDETQRLKSQNIQYHIEQARLFITHANYDAAEVVLNYGLKYDPNHLELLKLVDELNTIFIEQESIKFDA